MTDHPCKGLTPAQIAVFEQIACNVTEGHNPRVVLSLVKKGLVKINEIDLPPTRGTPFMVRVPIPYVPLHLHHQWCAWCAEQTDN